MFSYALLALIWFWWSNSCKWTICVYMCLQFTVSMLFKVPWTGRLCVEVRTAWASHMVTWHVSKGSAFRRGISHHIPMAAQRHTSCLQTFGSPHCISTVTAGLETTNAWQQETSRSLWKNTRTKRCELGLLSPDSWASASSVWPWIFKESHLQNYCISSAA